MDWAHVKAVPGQFIQLQIVVTDITHQSGRYGPYALGKAQDGPGQVEQVLFTVKQGDQFPTDLVVGHRINCAGKFDASTRNMKVFFDSYTQEQAPPPNSYPPQQQAPPPQQPTPPARRPANTPPPRRDARGKKETDWDAKELREHRGYALHDACTILISLAELNQKPEGLDPQLALEMAELFVKYRYDGPATPRTQPSGSNPQWVSEDPPPVDDSDSIPF